MPTRRLTRRARPPSPAAAVLLVLALLGLTAGPAAAATALPAAPAATGNSSPSPNPPATPNPSPSPAPEAASPSPSPTLAEAGNPAATASVPAPQPTAAHARPRQTLVRSGSDPTAPELTVNLADSTISDHATTTIILHLQRTDTTGAEHGLGYTVTLPTNLVVASTVVSNFCGGAVPLSEGGSTIELSNATLADTVAWCNLFVLLTSPASGTYQVTSDSVSGLAGGVVDAVTPQTLTVAPGKALLDAAFSPSMVAARAIGSMSLSLTRTDTNLSGPQPGLSYAVTLPTNLTVATGTPTNGCGGTVNASGSTVSLTGAAIAAGDASCAVTFNVTANLPGEYVIDPGTASGLVGVTAYFGGCDTTPHVRPHGDTCPLELTVTKQPQTITFPQPGPARLLAGTTQVSATSDSGLPVTFTSTTAAVCTVSGSTVTLLSAGICTIEANQAGDATWAAADTVSRSFLVTVPIQLPAVVTATAGVSSITASWSPSPDATGYRAIAHPGPATCTTTATSCVMGGIAGVAYTVTVIALSPDLGDSPEAGPSNEVTPSAPPVPSTPPATTLELTTDKGHINTAVPGDHIVLIGTGFAGYSTVTITLYSTPLVLGTAVPNGHGDFSKPVTIPSNLTAGHHTIVAFGVDPDGHPHDLGLAITVGQGAGIAGGLAGGVGAGGTGAGELPHTGADLAGLLLAGLVLTLAGTVTRIGGRRRA